MHISKNLMLALLVSVSFASIANAQEFHTQTTTTSVTRPLAVDGETNQVKPAVQRFIERINMARVALSLGEASDAKFDLDEAEKNLRFIKSNSNYQEITKK